MHKSSMLLMSDFRDRYLAEMRGCSVLDVGARMSKKQSYSYRDLFGDYAYTAMDIVAGQNVDIVGYDGLGVYDVVISGQVMEHVARPWEWMAQLRAHFRRYICIVAPNTWKEHAYPLDCYRFFPDGMRALFEYAGIAVVETRRVGVDTIGIGEKRGDYGLSK